MITKYEIENFKAFAGKQTLNLAPITLIYGPNSSGKSSVIQSLMMLKQTMLSNNKNVELVTSAESISLGTFESLIHGQDINNKMSFSIQYDSNHEAKEFLFNHSYPMIFGNADKRQLDFRYRQFRGNPFLDDYKFSCKDNSGEKVNFHLSNPSTSAEGITFKLTNYESLRKEVSKRLKLKSDDAKGWNALENNLYEQFKISTNLNLPTSVSETGSALSQYTDKVIDDIKYVFSDLKYLGPLRSSPKKFYSSDINSFQKGQGKHNLGLAIESGGKEVKNKINTFLESFNIPYTIDAKNLGDVNTGPLISLQLTDSRNGVTITPKDVGFGIGQVLPILFEAVVSKKKHICVEQPEIHLHPRLQANLADLFIDSVEIGKNQWIVETHSEAIMLRIQRRIREKVIPKEMVSVLYVDVGESGAQVTHIGLDDDGDFTTEWPEGFFEERINEILGK
jgi:AAA15 family ATPase/GTPase